MKKKLLLAVAMIAMLVCILAISVSASSYDTTRKVTLDNGTEVALYDNDGYALTYYLNDSGALTSAKTIDVISVNGNGVATYNGVATMKVVVANYQGAEIDALNVKQIPVYYNGANGGEYNTYNDVVEYIYLPDCLTTTVTNQFRYTSKLKIVDITRNSKLETLGQFSFYCATALVEFHYPPKVKTTPGYGNDGKWGTAATFSYCRSLKNLYFYDNSETETFGDNCFYGCTSLEYVELPDSLTSTPASLFSNCTALKELRIPNSVTSVGDRVVQGCSSLEKLWYPASMSSIGQSSTYLAGSLQYVYLPNTVTTATGSHHFTTEHTSYKKTVIFYNGTQQEAESFISLLQSKSHNEKYSNGNYVICAWDPTVADSAYVEKATTESKNYIVYGYNTCKAFYNDVHEEEVEDNNPCWLTECSNCGLSATYVGNDDTHSFVYSITYNGYFGNKGDKLATCQNENCIYHNTPKTEKEAVNAIISSFKGFSVSEDGDGLTFGYTIDYDALDAYVKTNGNNVELGFVIALQKNSGDNAPDINASTSITAKVVNWTTSDEENAGVAKYVGADFKVVGNWAGHEDVVFCMAGYLNDGKTVSYLNYESSSEKADTFYIAQFMN